MKHIHRTTVALLIFTTIVSSASSLQAADTKSLRTSNLGVGAKPAKGAEMILDGSRKMLDEKWTYWKGPRYSSSLPIKWKVVDDPVDAGKSVIQTDDPAARGGRYGTADIVTKKKYRDFRLHIEFLVMKKRGNSGVYLQNRYEVQILDSFGLVYERAHVKVQVRSDPRQWCGCFYRFKTADIPMCLPPLAWQTYDIDFTAPRFDAEGKKTADTTITVLHNGVKIHDAVQLPKGTGIGGTRPEVPRGPIIFQGHGNPVGFRNVWILER